MKFLALIGAATAISLRRADLPHDGQIDKLDPVSRYVNDDDLVQLNRADLPHDGEIDKLDPVSRYVNDDDIVQIKDEVSLV